MKECRVSGFAGDACRTSESECFFKTDIKITPHDQRIMTEPYKGKCPLYKECMKLRDEIIKGLR